MTQKRKRPAGTGRLTTTKTGTSITALVPVQARRNGTCWRCGAEFGSTDLAALAHCYELAREAS